MWYEKLKDGRYKYRERYPDPYTGIEKKVSVTMDRNSKQAEKQAAKTLNEKIKKKLKYNPITDNKTFIELYEEWFKFYKKQVKPTSYCKVSPIINNIFKTIKPKTLIKNIDDDLVNDLIDNIYYFGNYSLNYSKNMRTTLSMILDFGVKKKYIKENPVTLTEIKAKKIDEINQRKKISDKYLEKDEVETLLEYLNLKPNNKIHHQITEFLYQTGLRYGELIALQWKNFDGKGVMVEGTIDYTTHKPSEAVKGSTKNVSSTRYVDLSERCIEIISEIFTTSNVKGFSTNDDDFIFISNQNNPLSLHSFNGVMKTASENTDIKKHLTSHIFRHTHVSILAEKGVPLKTIMERVGHADSKTTIEVYNHVTKQSKMKVLNILNDL